jgi:hypothetical protein
VSQTVRCAACLRPLPRGDFHRNAASKNGVTSRCRGCRREEDYFSKRYQTRCGQCGRSRPLDRNRSCRACNEEAGLRQCRGACGELLPMYLEFYAGKGTCKRCAKAARPTSG